MRWVYGTPFLVDRDNLVATKLAIQVGDSSPNGRNAYFLGFGSDRFETQDCLDYARFRIDIAESLGAALGTTGRMYFDTSVFVDVGSGIVREISILSANVDDDVPEDPSYDAIIRFELTDGMVLSIGHSPGVYEGVCLTRNANSTLGSPATFWERIKLSL